MKPTLIAFATSVGLAGLFGSVTALKAQAWVGIWAADPAWCANAADIGVSETAPVRITAEKIEGLENYCDITNVSPVGVGQSWRADQSCSAEGLTYRYSELLIIDYAGQLHRLGEEGILSSFVRCESG